MAFHVSSIAPLVNLDLHPTRDARVSIRSAHPTALDTVIEDVGDDPKLIQEYCETQRSTRNETFKEKLLDESFKGVKPDTILVNLESKADYVDPRNNFVVWARPTQSIKELVARIQAELQSIAPNLWLMPLDNLHMTALEIVHSTTPDVVDEIHQKLKPCLAQIANYAHGHPSRLVKPKLSYDDAAVALTFVPAAGEGGRVEGDDAFTYLHLRRDLFQICHCAGVEVAARYATTSCHLTIARFITTKDHAMTAVDGETPEPDRERLRLWLQKLESLNAYLVEHYWPEAGESFRSGGEWTVGDEEGLDIRKGRVWYGGGESVQVGTVSGPIFTGRS